MDAAQALSRSLLRLQVRSPFFGTLALFAQTRLTNSVPTVATNGKVLLINPEFFGSLSPPQQDAIVVHEVLHMALLHALRRNERNPELWNIAADIVVNGIIASEPELSLPKGSVRAPKLEHLSVEEVYACLEKKPPKMELPLRDLLDPATRPDGATDESDDASSGDAQDGAADKSGRASSGDAQDGAAASQAGQDSLSVHWQQEVEAFWRNSLQQAMLIAESSKIQGALPAGIKRHLKLIQSAQVDWRTQLWRYLVQTPTDFQDFDRRFIHRGLYLEKLTGESVMVYAAVDTSGSVSDKLINQFLGEIVGILGAYPHIKVELYYADADVYGPYELEEATSIPEPEGGGGTSFCPFFERVQERWDGHTGAVCVYLTDGYGNFPEQQPELPVLWVVRPGGRADEDFPWGDVIRLV